MTGPELKQYRQRVLCLSQTELSKILEITLRTLSTHENARRVPKLLELAVKNVKQ